MDAGEGRVLGAVSESGILSVIEIFSQVTACGGARCSRLFAVDQFFTEMQEVLLIDARAEPT